MPFREDFERIGELDSRLPLHDYTTKKGSPRGLPEEMFLLELLEREPQSKVQSPHSWLARTVGWLGACNEATATISAIVGESEVYVIKGVEHFKPELTAYSLGDGEALEK